MKIIHLAGVLQTVYIMVFVASLQCVVSHWSELNIVTSYWPSFPEFWKLIFCPGEMPSITT